uniref:Uncharacterized protein n=1 Tax=Leptobrachium leishanense TaxID=445787 RepID=A0A8C5Q243_9ANUR
STYSHRSYRMLSLCAPRKVEAMLRLFREHRTAEECQFRALLFGVSFVRFIQANPIDFNVKNIPVLNQYVINRLSFYSAVKSDP